MTDSTNSKLYFKALRITSEQFKSVSGDTQREKIQTSKSLAEQEINVFIIICISDESEKFVSLLKSIYQIYMESCREKKIIGSLVK